MVTWNPGEILSARPTDSAPECGAPITKTGRVTLRALTIRRWRGGIYAVSERACLRRRGGGGRVVWWVARSDPFGSRQYRTRCADHICYVRVTTTRRRNQVGHARAGGRGLLCRRDRMRPVQQGA